MLGHKGHRGALLLLQYFPCSNSSNSAPRSSNFYRSNHINPTDGIGATESNPNHICLGLGRQVFRGILTKLGCKLRLKRDRINRLIGNKSHATKYLLHLVKGMLTICSSIAVKVFDIIVKYGLNKKVTDVAIRRFLL